LIGKGAVGSVFKAINTLTGEFVAIKQIDLHGISKDHVRSIQTEISLLTKLDHKNIVKYIDIIETKTNINIILEYIEGGSLHNIVKLNGMPECLVCVFTKQILEGLDYLHTQGIIHRDIKGANLLITKTGTVKLADFGYSVKLCEREKTNSTVGTCYWMAPEVIEQKGIISYACDIWSLGCTIIQLLTTKPPYYAFDTLPAMYRIVVDEFPPLPENIPENLKSFLLQCFIKDQQKRPTAKELLNHPWITTPPNRKMFKKILHENTVAHIAIPSSIMQDWNNVRDNLSSMTSSYHERMDRTASNHEIVKEYNTYNYK
jgi:serine/threonine protein kinase